MYRDEHEPFLEKGPQEQREQSLIINSELEALSARRKDRNHGSAFTISVAINIFLGVVVVLLLATHPLLAQLWNGSPLPEPYSPAKAAIEHNYGAFVNGTDLLGKPGPLWERAMSDLMSGTLIRLSEEELKRANMTSVAVKGGGFAGGLGVAHNLHCVKRIKQFLYFEHFYPEVPLNSEKYEEIRFHADHCLDFIRQDLMCHINYSLYTLEWGPGPRGDITLIHQAPQKQKCVNWDSLQSWMKSRAVSQSAIVDTREKHDT